MSENEITLTRKDIGHWFKSGEEGFPSLIIRVSKAKVNRIYTDFSGLQTEWPVKYNWIKCSERQVRNDLKDSLKYKHGIRGVFAPKKEKTK